MKAKPDMKLARLVLCACTTAVLAACGNSTPSTSDAKAALKSRIADCSYLTLKDVSKTNGIPGDGPSTYRLEVSYSMKLEPTDEQKESLKHWTDDAQQAVKLNEEYMQALKADSVAQKDSSQDTVDYATKRSDVQSDMKKYLSIPNFFNKVANDCPNVPSQFVHSFYDAKGPLSDYTDDGITSTFTETISMVKTDNGWQEAR